VIITEILARNARMYPDETALIERDGTSGARREITWTEFDHQANQVANLLLSRGIGKGNIVIHLLMNSLEWLPLYFGILRTGAWVVPLNFRFNAEDIKYCIEIAEADAIFFGSEFVGAIDEIRESITTVKHYFFVGDGSPAFAENCLSLSADQSDVAPEVSISIDDNAALYFTSGTTGRPKAILLTQRNLEASCIVENQHHRQTHDDNFILIPPLYHTGAKMHWFGSFIVGGRAVVLKGVTSEWILDAISEEGGTIVWLLVPWARDILTAIENGKVNLDYYRLDQWRLMHIGAQPVPPSLVTDWLKVFPHHQYDTNYGLTESTGPGCVHLGIENTHKVGAIGVPGFDWEYAIVDDRGIRVKPGVPGELIVKGPGVMREYYKNPEETINTIKDGWLYTKDIARVDDEGFIYLVDRKKDVIITGGENIFPVEIENFLQRHPDIQDVGVIGFPDERLGEVVAAVIEAKPERAVAVEDIHRYCEALPRYKRPQKIFFDCIPRNPTGKIEKPKLREKFAGYREMFKS